MSTWSACQNGSLNTGAARATCCAVGEATRGHNAVATLVHAAAQSCGCTAEMEVLGLIPGADLRPADVLTSALGNSPPPSTSRSALRMHNRLALTVCRPHTRPNSPTMALTPSLLRQNISYTPICVEANATLSPPKLSVGNFMPASTWKSGNAALGKFGLVGRTRPPRTLWTQNHSSCPGPWPSLLRWSALLRRPSRFFSLDSVLSAACAFVCSQPFHVLGSGAWPSPAWGPPSPIWKPRLRMMFKFSWKRLRNLWSRSLPRGLSLVLRTSVPARVS